MTSAQSPDTVPAQDEATLTPTLRETSRRRAFWIAIGALLLLLTVVAAVASVGGGGGLPLDATSAGPSGSMAITEVLRDHGVKVDATFSLDATEASATNASDTTILVYDDQRILDSGQRARLLRLADNIVLVDPSAEALEDLAPDVSQADSLRSADRKPGCTLTAATNAGTVRSSGTGYSISDGAIGCYQTQGASGLVFTAKGNATVTVLGMVDVLTNEKTLDAGNAALALNLLGTTDHLVWYLPSTADLPGANGSGQSLGDLSPDWVIPLTSLLAIAALAAIVWRSRRFGALVVENLPVVVRSSETMEGRARLYERGSDRLHALDALRIATIDRLATTCGLSRRSSLDEVIDAVSSVTARDRATVAAVLVDALPATDAELVRLSDELLRLEHDTTAATRAR